jgi:hypothetical protein
MFGQCLRRMRRASPSSVAALLLNSTLPEDAATAGE